MNKEDFQRDIFPILILTIIVCVAVVALTVVNSVTAPEIEKNAEEATLAALQELFPEMDAFEYHEDIGVYTILKDNTTTGYAFEAVGQGYGGDIVIMVGLENTTMEEGDIILRNITITSASGETPGLGQLITEDEFIEMFSGINADSLQLSKDGGKIDAISGATISSRAVTDTVREAVNAKAALIRENILEVV